jgi:kynureninase
MDVDNLDFARSLDQQDELARFRQRFVPTDPDLIYLDGNSLGRLPLATQQRLQDVIVREWGQRLIRSWNEGWIDAAARIGGKIAALTGAAADEVLLADSTSINLYKLALSALLAQPKRRKIITDDLNFPSDLYILRAVCELVGDGCQLEVIQSEDGIHGPVGKLAEAVDENTALLSLSHTVFKSGYTYDMKAVTSQAQRAGALVLWDLSHSVGAMPIDLEEAHVDLAVGCTYKYLNGGPGSPAFLYVRRDWQDKLINPISGWMGHKDLFAFDLDYEAAPGLRRFITGTPAILSLSAVEPGVDMLFEAGMEAVRAKSVRLSQYLLDLWRETLMPLGFKLNSPTNNDLRGSHISLGHTEGYRIDQALIAEMNVLPDFRAPDNIRFGLVPLYTSFTDLVMAVSRLKTVVTEKRYQKYSQNGGLVT